MDCGCCESLDDGGRAEAAVVFRVAVLLVWVAVVLVSVGMMCKI
jgi:hypothetical protein